MSNRRLNCQGNQLAIIITAPATRRHLIGKIIRITTRAADSLPNPGYPQYDTTATWHYAGPRMRTTNGNIIARVNDCVLRPLIDITQNTHIESTTPITNPR